MIFTETKIAGAYLVDMEPMRDDRGFFARAWSVEEFGEMGLETEFPAVNFSVSARQGTIRGLHYQKAPHADAKFVRCVRGALFDVVLDLRPESPTFRQWAGFEIRASDYRAIYVPAGCAHGIQTLEDDTEMLYMVSACYRPGAEGGIRWDDPFFGIEWPDCEERIVSEKDQLWPDYDAAAGLIHPRS
jgi:dTDP-4-dehydrorhamnose 3,5-epimerase